MRHTKAVSRWYPAQAQSDRGGLKKLLESGWSIARAIVTAIAIPFGLDDANPPVS